LGFEEIVNCFAADGLLKARAAGVFTKQIMANPAAATLAGPAGRGQTRRGEADQQQPALPVAAPSVRPIWRIRPALV